MALPADKSKPVDGETSTGTTAITNPQNYHKHQFGCLATGTTSVPAEWSNDGSNWFKAADAVSLTASATNDTIYLDGVFPQLRLSYTVTSGAISVWMVQSDTNTTGAR